MITTLPASNPDSNLETTLYRIIREAIAAQSPTARSWFASEELSIMYAIDLDEVGEQVGIDLGLTYIDVAAYADEAAPGWVDFEIEWEG